MVQWLAPVPNAPPDDGEEPLTLTDEDIFRQRGDHELWFHPEDEACWQAQFPYLAWKERITGGATWQGVTAGELAKLVMPFLTVSEEAAHLHFASAQPTPAAWTRWLHALQKAAVTPHPDSLSVWLREADTRVHAGGAEIAAALVVTEEDLGPTEEASLDGLAEPAHTILRAGGQICWGMLCNDDGKLVPAGDLIYYSDTLMRAVDRSAKSAWYLTIAALYNIGCVDHAITISNKGDSSHVALWMVRLLAQTELDPILEVYHAAGFARTMALRDRLAERPGAASRGDAGRGLAAMRLSMVLKHFKLLALLVATEAAQERLKGPARVALLLQAARVLLPVGTFDPSGGLSVQLLQQLEDALARYSHLLADPDFKAKAPLQRLADVAERNARSATAATTAADTYSLPTTPEGASSAKSSTGLGGIPKQWKEHAEKALASPEYMAVRKDALARLAKDDGDLEIDAIWTCSTGDSVERMQARMRAQAADATKEEQEAAANQQRRFSALMFFYAHGVYEPDALDPALASISTFAADYWPGLLARRLAAVLLPFDEELPGSLLGAKCPALLEALQGRHWHKADVRGAVKYLRALMAGQADAEERDFASTADNVFGDPRNFGQLRKYYAVVLTLFGYPDTDAKYGWGSSLSRAAALWESYHGANPDVDARLRTIIDKFLCAQFAWMGRHVAALKTTKDPLAAPPLAELDRSAWSAFLQSEGDLRTALASSGLVRWAAVFGGGKGKHEPAPKAAPGSEVPKGLPKGASVEPMANKAGFIITPAQGKAQQLTYALINAELRRKGVPAGEENSWCLKHLLGMSAFKASACRAQGACSRKHGHLPLGSFSIKSCKSAKPPQKDAGGALEATGAEEDEEAPKAADLPAGKAKRKAKAKADGGGGKAAKKAVKAATAATLVEKGRGASAPASSDDAGALTPPPPPLAA